MSLESFKPQSRQMFNVPFVAQIDSSDCGAACLSMVAQYFQKGLVLSEARHLCGNDVTGQRIAKVASRNGLNAGFIKKNFTSLMESGCPVIAHWEGNHWVVICGFKDGKVKIADPASGVYWLKYDEAEKSYSDYSVIIDNQSERGIAEIKREHVLLKCLSPFKRSLIASTLIMLIIIGVEMFIPYTFQQITDEDLASKEDSFQWLMTYAGMAAVVVIFGFALLNFMLYRGAMKSENLVLDSLLSKWINLPENFYKGRSFSELRARMESAFEIKRFLVEAAGSGLFALLEIIAVFAILEYYSMALPFALLLLPSLILTFYTLYLSKENAGLFKFAKDSFLTKVDDITQGVFSIRAASAIRKFKSLQSSIKEEMYERVYPLERKILICEKGAVSLGIGAWILLFFQMCRKFVDHEVSSGVMFAVIILAAMALNALYRIISKREKYENAALIYDYLNDVLDTKDEEFEKEKLSGSAIVSIEDEEGEKISIGAGEKLFVYGDDSVDVVDLFLNEDSSSYKTDMKIGTKEFSAVSSYPALSVLEEHAHIFNMSLLENVTLGEDVDVSRVKWCLRLAMADHLTDELPQSLNTKINKGSLSLSDQRKIHLARCLYRKRPLYILCDLSSFLTRHELLLFAYHLKTQMPEKTMIIQDSNLGLGKSCDQISIMLNDSIREKGSFSELMNMEKFFFVLYNKFLKK